MKRLSIFLAGCAVALAACTTTPGADPVQKVINATATACRANDAAIVATDEAVLNGVLKGDNARTALKGLTASQSGCVAALGAIKSATAASGVTP